MCWNETISLNTFIFTTGCLLFIAYNHYYTKYKLSEFNNPIIYLLIFSFTSMQLIEYFMWRSIKTNNKNANYFASIAGWILIYVIQPAVLLYISPKKYEMYRNILAAIYIAVFVAVNLYKYLYSPFIFQTGIGNNGHLDWEWYHLYGYENIFGLCYFACFIFVFFQFPITFSIIFATLFFLYAKYKKVWGSLWCFICNGVLLLLLIELLVVLPYKEYRTIC